MNNSNEINKIENANLNRQEVPDVETLGTVEKEPSGFDGKVPKKEKTTGVDVVAEELKVTEDVAADEVENPWSVGFHTSSKIKSEPSKTRIENANMWIEALMRKIRERQVA